MLAQLYETHYTAWIRHAKESQAGHNAEDAVHDAMVAVLEGAEPEPDEAPEVFIPRLIRRCATRVRLQDMRRGMILEARAHQPDTPSWSTLERDIAIRRAVESLQGISPELVWRGLAQGETCRDLARHCSYPTVSRRLRRARGQLAEVLAPYRENRTRRHTAPSSSITSIAPIERGHSHCLVCLQGGPVAGT